MKTRALAVRRESTKRLLAGFAAVMLLAAVFAVQAVRAQEAASPAAPAEPAAPTPPPYVPPATGPIESDGYYEIIEAVAPGVWVIRQAEPFHLQPSGNVTVIEQSDGLVMVDGGGSPGAARRIAALIRTVSSKPVKALIITHWHGDHSLGFGTLQTMWPDMQVIATETTKARLVTSMDFYAQGAPDPARTTAFMGRLSEADEFLRAAAVSPRLQQADRDGFARAARDFVAYRADSDGLFVGRVTRPFTGALVLDDPKRPVQVFNAGRGNTDGDAAVWVGGARALVTGDLVVAPIPFGFNGYPAEWAQALNVLAAYDFKVLVPGHGAPQRDRSYLTRLSASMAALRAAVGELARGTGKLEDAQKQVATLGAEAFTGGDIWLARWYKNYWTEPFAETVWKETRGEPIVQGHG